MANAIGHGFWHIKDVFNRQVTEVGVDVINDAITQTVAEHRRQMDAFLPLFVRPTTDFKTKYLAPIRTRNQPLTDQGRARPIKGGTSYEVAWPILDSGNAWGYDWKTGQKMTVEQVNDATLAIVDGDMDWMFDNIIAALVTNTTWDFPDKEHGDLTVQPLANGDAIVYQTQVGGVIGATDDHYTGQANPIGAAGDNPYPVVFNELDEHPENGSGNVIAFIPTSLRATTEALGTFHPIADPNVQLGSASDVLTGSLGRAVPGRVIGYVDPGVWVVEWKRLAAIGDRMIVIHDGGPPPLAMREETQENLRGLIEITPSPARQDYPWYERQWVRYAGFGAWNRVAATVHEIGDATYDIPTNFTAPII